MIFSGYVGLQKWIAAARDAGDLHVHHDQGVYFLKGIGASMIQFPAIDQVCGLGVIRLPEFKWTISLPWEAAWLSKENQSIVLRLPSPKIGEGRMSRIAIGLHIDDWSVTTAMINAGRIAFHRCEFLDDKTPVAISTDPLFSVPLLGVGTNSMENKNRKDGML